MSYGTKYRLNYHPVRGDETCIEVKQESYSSSVTDLVGSGNPLILMMDSAGEPIETTIKTTKATAELVSESDFQFQEIFLNSTAKEWMLYVYKGDRTSELLDNRTFQGSLEDWDTTTNFIWDKDSAMMDSTSSNGTLSQNTISLPAGTYTIYVKYTDANTSTKEHIDCTFAAVNRLSEDISDESGTLSDSFVIAYPTTSIFSLVKSWVAGSDTSTLRITEISLALSAAAGVHDYNLFWKGFIQPDIYTEPLAYPPYKVQATASCGLAKLENLDFLDNGSYYTGYDYMINVIQDALDLTEIYLPLKVSINLYESYLFNDDEDPLAKLRVTFDRFRDGEDVYTWQEVVDAILKIFYARLYQSDGYWNIERINNKIGDYTAIVYNQFGDEINSALSCNDVITLTDNSASAANLAVWSGQKQVIELEQSYIDIPLQQNLDKRSVINGSFESVYWDSTTQPTYWTKYNSPSVSRNETAVKILGTEQIHNFSTSPYIQLDSPNLFSDIHDYKTHKINVSYDIRCYNGNYSKELYQRVYFYYHDSTMSKDYYLVGVDQQGDPITGLLGTPSLQKCEYSTTPSALLTIFPEKGGLTDWRSVNIQSEESNWYDKIRIKIFAGDHNNQQAGQPASYIEIKNLEVTVECTGYEDTKDSEFTISNDNFKKHETYEVDLGDFARLDMEVNPTQIFHLYNGYLWTESGITNAQWGEWGTINPFGDLIHDVLKGCLVAQYKHSRHIYRGAIHGGNISFSSVLKDTGNSSRHFLCRSLEINDKHAMADGEWIELYETTLDDGSIPGVGEADFDSTDWLNTDWVTD